MSTPTWSVLHATYGRPQKAVATMRMWFERAARPEEVEYVFACNCDDPTSGEFIRDALKFRDESGREIKIVAQNYAGSAPAWDAAAKASRGLVLIQASDDVEPPQLWDKLLARAMAEYDEAEDRGPYLSGEPQVVAVSDGYRKDALMTVAICNRARYEQVGEFIHGGYRSVFSDDEFTIRALADAADGKCTLIDARDVVMLHRHHYHDKTVPFDVTYQRQNSSDAYESGRALFMARNSELVLRGLRSWC